MLFGLTKTHIWTFLNMAASLADGIHVCLCLYCLLILFTSSSFVAFCLPLRSRSRHKFKLRIMVQTFKPPLTASVMVKKLDQTFGRNIWVKKKRWQGYHRRIPRRTIKWNPPSKATWDAKVHGKHRSTSYYASRTLPSLLGMPHFTLLGVLHFTPTCTQTHAAIWVDD